MQPRLPLGEDEADVEQPALMDFSERGDPDEAAAHSVEVFNETAGLRRRANEAVLRENN